MTIEVNDTLDPTLRKKRGERKTYSRKFTFFSSVDNLSLSSNALATMPPKIALIEVKLPKNNPRIIIITNPLISTEVKMIFILEDSFIPQKLIKDTIATKIRAVGTKEKPKKFGNKIDISFVGI
jgi:hypothetical protein